ncbi:MAG: indole-3-glycerol phosphate synthase TrpC [Acidobacteriota bacterium]
MTTTPAGSMANLLDAIVASARCTVEARRIQEPESQLEKRAARCEPRAAVFRDALARPGRVNVIAECKRRSPARGVLRHDYHPGAIAQMYQDNGASAVSVLTEPAFFDGSLSHLEEVRAAVTLPLLRKDFVVDRYQLLEARAAGADAVLVIVAACSTADLTSLIGSAHAWGLAALVEAHSADEIRRAVDAGATIIGVNSRSLKTLDVNLRTCDALVGEIPPGCVAVAESGIGSAQDVGHLTSIGYQAVLIGEWLMSAADPGATLRAISGLTGIGPGKRCVEGGR